MHPPLSGDRIGHDARINCIHYRSSLVLTTQPRCVQGPSGDAPLPYLYTMSCGQKPIRNSRVCIYHQKGLYKEPDVRCSLTSGMRTYPLYSFLRYFRKSPANKLPFDKVLGTAHLYVSQRNIFFFGFLTVLT